MKKEFIIAYFEDEHKLLHTVKVLKDLAYRITDVVSPFPLHGIDKLLDLKSSRIPTAGFWFGAFGTIFALFFQWWIFTVDWPINFGGKPFFALPSFIPVIFEITVLFACLGMICSFLYRCNLFPGADNKIYINENSTTNDIFMIVIDKNTVLNQEKLKIITEILKNNGAVKIEYSEK